MPDFKNLFIVLFSFIFGQAFSQKSFDLTVSLDSSINSKNVSCYYDDGIDNILVKDTFVNNILKLKADFHSKFVSFRIDYDNKNGKSLSNTFFIDGRPATIHFTGRLKINESQLAYDSIKNALPVFDTATNKIWKELSIYIQKQTQAISDFWEKYGSEIGKSDSITHLNQKLFRSLNDRSIQFLRNYSNDYFSFWFFREEILRPSVVFMSKDTNYMKNLLFSFNTTFPISYTESFEGQNVIKKLKGLIKANERNRKAPIFFNKRYCWKSGKSK